MSVNLSDGARQLLLDLAADAPNWSGTPLFGGNVGGSHVSKGHLTKLKRAGLLVTETDPDDPSLVFVHFTKKGLAVIEELLQPEEDLAVREGREVEQYGWTVEEIDQQLDRDGVSQLLTDDLSNALDRLGALEVRDGRTEAALETVQEILRRAKFIVERRLVEAGPKN